MELDFLENSSNKTISSKLHWTWSALVPAWPRSRCYVGTLVAIHTSELDRSEIDLSPKRSNCERSNTNCRDQSKIDLNECEHFLNLRSILGAIYTSELDRSEIDLSPKRPKCERSNTNWDRSKIDLNECEHFLKANWDRSQIDPT